MLSGRLRTQKDRGATSTSHCHPRMAPIYSSKFPLNLQLSAGCAENFNPARPNVAKHPNGNSPPKLAGELDRKSTRLNSSHVRISYAVFCLKKKILIRCF